MHGDGGAYLLRYFRVGAAGGLSGRAGPGRECHRWGPSARPELPWRPGGLDILPFSGEPRDQLHVPLNRKHLPDARLCAHARVGRLLPARACKHDATCCRMRLQLALPQRHLPARLGHVPEHASGGAPACVRTRCQRRPRVCQ